MPETCQLGGEPQVPAHVLFQVITKPISQTNVLHRPPDMGLGPWPGVPTTQQVIWPSHSLGPSPPNPTTSRAPCQRSSQPTSPCQGSTSQGLSSFEGPMLFVPVLVTMTSWCPEEVRCGSSSSVPLLLRERPPSFFLGTRPAQPSEGSAATNTRGQGPSS